MQDSVGQVNQYPHSDTESHIKAYFCKMKAGKCAAKARFSVISLLVTAMGSFAGIGLVAVLSDMYNLPLLLPSFGASAVTIRGVSCTHGAAEKCHWGSYYFGNDGCYRIPVIRQSLVVPCFGSDAGDYSYDANLHFTSTRWGKLPL